MIRVAELPGRRSRRSARTNRLLVPSRKLSTVGGRAHHLEQPDIYLSVNLPLASKNIYVPGLAP